jgi:hypothetical protein
VLYQILSSHDVVSHALQTHYPDSIEAGYDRPSRNRSTFDAVVRRSYTQPRRKNARSTTEMTCFPLFCSEADQVFAYQTAAQKSSDGWECTLRNMSEDMETIIELKHTIGGCYNKTGDPYISASVKDVWCELGRGYMVVGGKHKHSSAVAWADRQKGVYNNVQLDMGYSGVHIAPKWGLFIPLPAVCRGIMG